MSFYKEVPGRQTTLESTLKFDTKPTEGSTNPVTSDGVKGAIDGAVGDASEALQEQIDEIAEKAGSGYTPKGPASVATLNGLTGQENGWLYTMTDAGTLTDGSLAVVAGDTVAWDATNSVWYKAMDYAPAQYGTNEVHNLTTTITAFRTGDVIPVDGPSGTAKMSKDDLLRVTAENALGSIKSLSDRATESDFVAGNYGAIDTSSGAKKEPLNLRLLNLGDVYYKYGYTTLAQCHYEGVYQCTAGSLSYITDLPWGIPSGNFIMIVKVSSNNYVIQTIIRSNGNMYFRTVNTSDNTASAWESNFNNRGDIYTNMNRTSLEDVQQDGIYRLASSNFSHITDLPAGINATFTLIVKRLDINGYYNQQIILCNNGRVFWRNAARSGGAGTTSAWHEVAIYEKGNEEGYFKTFGDVYGDLEKTTLESCSDEGFYRLGSGNFSHVTDLPSGISATFTLFVKRLDVAGRYNQQIIRCNDGKVYWRNVAIPGHGGTTSNWHELAVFEKGVEEGYFKTFGDIYVDLGYTSFAECLEDGVYRCGSANYASITDKPDTLTATCTLYVKRIDLDNKYVQQIIIANNGQIYWRNCARPNSGGTTSAWKNFTQNYLTRWAAMGDSITEGVYSTGNGYQTAVTAKNYPYYVSMINGWNYTNYGKGGAGYVRPAPSDSKNAMQKANEINFANFDIVTLAYGVNDWHYAQPIGSLETSTDGDGTMVGNMKATIKKILSDNPLIKIVVILPHNCSRYGGGDYDSNWGYGHGDASTSGTLKSVIDKEIEVCEYFGIQYIDNVHNGIVTRENINQFLLDGIHPRLEGYLPIAKYIAKQIMFS